jgi:hypothetical protein
MDECCTTMTVVPTDGKITAPLLGCGPTEAWPGGGAVTGALVPPLLLLLLLLVAVATAVTDEAGAAGPEDPLLTDGAPEPEPAAEVALDPPHAVSSRASEAIPVAAAHPLLRITSLPFTEMTRS